MPEILRPLSLRRTGVMLLASLALLNLMDMSYSVNQIGTDCEANLTPAQMVQENKTQTTCLLFKFTSKESFCKIGAAAEFLSDLFSFAISLYGIVIFAAYVPKIDYIISMAYLVFVQLAEKVLSVYLSAESIAVNNFPPNHPCGIEESQNHSTFTLEDLIVEIVALILSAKLFLVLLIYRENVNRGGTGDESVTLSDDVMSLLSVPPPSILMASSSFFGMLSVRLGALLTSATVAALSLFSLGLSGLRLGLWCKAGLDVEDTVCNSYGIWILLQSLVTFLLSSGTLWQLLKKTERFRVKGLTTMVWFNLVVFCLACSSIGVSLFISASQYPTYSFSSLWIDLLFLTVKCLAILYLTFLLYSLQLIQITGASGLEKIEEVDEIAQNFFHQ